MQIIKASSDVIEEISKMVAENKIESRNLRIAARLDQDEGQLAQGFRLFQSEVTLNDHVQEYDGFNIIVAKILVDLYGGFTLSLADNHGKKEIVIISDRQKPARYKGSTFGTATKTTGNESAVNP